MTYLKRTSVTLSAVFVLATYLCAGMAVLLPIATEKHRVYFIVDPTDSVEASVGAISLRGGAGYALSDGGVAFNVYFSPSDAEAVYKDLLDEYPTAELRVYTKSTEWNAQEELLMSSLKVVEGWIEVLKQGATQERVRDGLQEVVAVLQYSLKTTDFLLIEEFVDSLNDCIEGTITVGELRYCLCFASEKLWSDGERI